MIGTKVKIIDHKLGRFFGIELVILWNIPKSTKSGVTTHNFAKVEPNEPSKLWALGIEQNQSIATCYAGESQFEIIPLEKHTKGERLNGINRVCVKESTDIKRCLGFGMVGDRACDTRHVPGHNYKNSFILCKYHKDHVNNSHRKTNQTTEVQAKI